MSLSSPFPTLFTLLSLLLIISLPLPTTSKCTMTSPNILHAGTYPTVPNEVPLILPQHSYEIISEICPHLVRNDTMGAPHTFCCNSTQIDILKANFGTIDASFNKCPACAESMKRMWCDFTCSSNQADFVEIQGMTPPENIWVHEARFVLSMKFQDEFWQCCKRNVLGQVYIENQFVNIRAFLPGCLAMQKPPPNPFVVFKFLNKDEKYAIPGYDGDTVPCETSCTCQYCENSCKNPRYRPLTPDYSCRMFGIKCYVVFVVAGGLMSVLVGFACAWGITGRLLLDRVSTSTRTRRGESSRGSKRPNTTINSTPDLEASLDDDTYHRRSPVVDVPRNISSRSGSSGSGGRLFNPGIRESPDENSALLERRRS